MSDWLGIVSVVDTAIVVVLVVLGLAGLAVVTGLWWWRRRGSERGGSEVCWIHYDRFAAGGRCRVCGLRGGYTGVKKVVVVLDHGRGSGEWKCKGPTDRRGGVPWAVYESDGPPEAWYEKGTLCVDWLRYGKPLSFDGVEIVRATDEEVESFVQQARSQSEETVRARLREMDCAVGAGVRLSGNTLRVLGTTFGRVVREEGLRESMRSSVAAQRRFPLGRPLPLPSMVWIESGTFTMGSPAGEAGRFDREGPQTEVRISRGYWLGKYEVTQGEYQAVMGTNPSQFKGEDLPVEDVSWNDAMEYCRRLTVREREAGRLPAGWEYRLPTEAQWEYGCRAGTETAYSFGDRETDLGRYAWYWANSEERTHPVGQKEPNGWGLYDMHGNVWEWCLDWYGDRLPGGSVTDPTGPASGSDRVRRGGSWQGEARYCRSAVRNWDVPSFRVSGLGFRVALVQVP